MTALSFKKEVDFEKGSIYSVCLRGARRYDITNEFDLSLYTPEYWEKPKEIANIISQNHYRFYDLEPTDTEDNYDVLARGLAGLKEAMKNVYPDFEEREIVTILRFKIA